MDNEIKFEKIDFQVFVEEAKKLKYNALQDISKYYDNFKLPTRSTSGSCGYDFHLPLPKTVFYGNDDSIITVPTGVKAKFPKDKMLIIAPRSSIYKKNLTLANTIGIIDSDYYGNPSNDGHILLKFRILKSEGLYTSWEPSNCPINDPGYMAPYVTFDEGERIAQGMFMNCFFVTNEEEIDTKRDSGFGSTGK